MAGDVLAVHKMLQGLLNGWWIGVAGMGAFGALVLPGLGALIAFKRSKKADEVTLLAPTPTASVDSVVLDAKQFAYE